MLQDYMKLKRKKMSQQMMVLADCIALEEPLPEGLLGYFQHLSEVAELTAVAYKDLQGASQAVNNEKLLSNNLFYFWLLHTKGQQALKNPLEAVQSLNSRTEFFRYIEEYGRELMETKYKLKESRYFDNSAF